MIDELDQVLRQLLIRELPVKNGEVDIEFHQPRREWSAHLNRPTLNLFLYHLCENMVLRQPEWEMQRNGDGTATRRRKPVRVDLHYMITAWAAEPEDEHRLLARTMMALCRTATLPEDLLPESFRNQPAPIPLRVADPETLRNPADLWNALDNELRPSVSCVVTLALNPYQLFTGPLVRTRELRFGQVAPLPQPGESLWAVGGSVRGPGPFAGLRFVLLERGLNVPISTDGRFIVGNLEQGEYTLELQTAGRQPRQYRITVPSLSYDIEL